MRHTVEMIAPSSCDNEEVLVEGKFKIMCEGNKKCKQEGRTWNWVFISLGILSSVMAFGQSILQIYALRISVMFFVIPYIWFFILDTWATVIYLGYTIRLLYLVKCRRCSDLSRFWWYFAVIVMVVNPVQSIWWWLHEDYLLAYVSVPASCIYFVFFVLVCRSMAPGKLKKKKEQEELADEIEEIELG